MRILGKIEKKNRLFHSLTPTLPHSLTPSLPFFHLQENVELTKVVQELKVKIEELSYSLKSSSATVEEYRRKCDNEEAVSSSSSSSSSSF